MERRRGDHRHGSCHDEQDDNERDSAVSHSLVLTGLRDHDLRVGDRAVRRGSRFGEGRLPTGLHDASVTITMFDVQVDPASPVPLHEQVAGRLRRAIAEGEAGPGERLPPAKDLAAVLGVNSNTVLRALRTLRDEGLLEFRRGRGITVAGDAPTKGMLIARAQELVKLAQR